MTEGPLHPGQILKREFLDPMGVSPYSLAKAIGVHVRRVSELIKGHRAITPDTAVRLGLFFDVPPRWWLEMQARFDAHDPARTDILRNVVKPYSHLDRVLVTPGGARPLPSSAPPTLAGPQTTAVSDNFVDRLRAQAALGAQRAGREPTVIELPDGTPTLTGR